MKKNTALLTRKTSISRIQLLLVAGIVAISGVYLVTRIFAASATLSILGPATTSVVNIGDNVVVTVRENSSTVPVNAVQSSITFDSTKLSFLGSSLGGSAFQTEAQKSQPGATGTLTFVNAVQADANNQVVPVTGDQLVTTLTFKALAGGPATLGLATSSLVIGSADNKDIAPIKNGLTINLADTAAPSVPAGLTAGTSTLTGTTLNWAASTDNVGVTGYRVFRNGTQVATTTAPTYADVTGLAPGTSYTYKVASVDAAGNVSVQSAQLIISTLADTTAPSVPGKPTSSVQTMTSITVNWAASTDNVGVTSYQVFRNGTSVGTPNTNSYTDNGLTMNTSYTYTVLAKDAAGNASDPSAGTAFKTLADTQAPTTPSAFKGTVNVAAQSIAFTWTASTDNVAVTSYEISRDGTAIGSIAATGTSTSYTATNATIGTHVYSIVAKDAAGNVSVASTGLSLQLYLAADVNRDGKVNVFDLSSVLTNWSATGTNAADINGDSVVNIFDLSILLTKWTG